MIHLQSKSVPASAQAADLHSKTEDWERFDSTIKIVKFVFMFGFE